MKIRIGRRQKEVRKESKEYNVLDAVRRRLILATSPNVKHVTNIYDLLDNVMHNAQKFRMRNRKGANEGK